MLLLPMAVLCLGICNGFQVLTEMGLLPGALTRNQNLHFICEPCELVVSPGSCHLLKGYGDQERVQFPIAHGEGRYQCQADTLSELEQNGQLVLALWAATPMAPFLMWRAFATAAATFLV